MDPNAVICQLYTYNADAYLLTRNSPKYYAEHFASRELQEDKVHWLNFHSIEDRPHIEQLCENLSIGKLSVEDIYNECKRSKLDEYPNYLIFTIKSALPRDSDSFLLQQEKITFILGENYLLSFQERSSDHFTDVRDRIEHKRGKIRSKGPDFLMFRLLESITDNYFEVLDDIVASIEKLEGRITRNPHSDTLKRIETQKRRLIELRKVVFPIKEITSHLEKMDSPFLKHENYYYFSELKDNCLTVLEEIDANKQILEGMANLYYAVQGQKMNQIMKLLTVISAIFIPLTFIVGVYGMNFENMPELKSKHGYYIAWAVMISLAGLLLYFFHKRGWLNK